MNKEAAVTRTSPGRRRKAKGRFLRFLAGATAVLAAILLARQFIPPALSDVQLLSVQEAVQTVKVAGMLIKEETVVSSPATGRVTFTEDEGRRLEKGAAAALVAAGQDSGGTECVVYAPVAGILCTHLDGLESILSPGNLDVLDLSKFDKIAVRTVSGGEKVEKGQPVFKIVDNLSPVYFYAEIPGEAFPSGMSGDILHGAWNGLPLSIRPYRVVEGGDGWKGLFILPAYPENIVHNRWIEIDVTTASLCGLLVPRRAIVYRDGSPGIYLAVKKKARWTKVKIEGELAGKVAITGQGLDENTRYVKNPVLVREGWPVE
ncbi:MAG: hypothetical protein HPY89_02865 [Pelotomaculum sp.]|uniref:RND related barrel-sandwich hybrid domain-containing protein n=1 Tax=Pelotomaculum thermopropionicum (strain DSM 13744 / JCM 10971 / SI) TaxID=370438 RepID=A5D188_PELTS|nr:hypothetical protein [Pelotomaculum sp.]BAF60010.1 hypothetical protein PTH_1829 [Pelotomaculum thermopropionicum SI]